MIRRLRGEIVSQTDHTVLLDVQGVGYLIYVPRLMPEAIGSTVILNTYLAVRENALDLYGFTLLDELELFEQLLTLPKIGPKSALQILSQADLMLIKTAVANNDPQHLSKMSGMGKKTAEKVVAGLAELYEKHGLSLIPSTPTSDVSSSNVHDTIDALITLGYPESDARRAVQQILEAEPKHLETNAILKAALKLLS